MDKNKLAEEYMKSKQNEIVSDYIYTDAYLAGFDAAESIANAKIQELEFVKQELEVELAKVSDEYQGLKQMSEFLDKQYYKQRAELDRYKISNETDAKSIREMAKNIKGLEAKITDLEQQLKKSEEVIMSAEKSTDAVLILRQYLKSRGE